MPIKDKEKRKEYQRELMKKRRNKGLTENVSPDNFVSPSSVSPVSPVLDPNSNVSPEEKKLDPVRPCPRCSELENQLVAVATLPTAYIDERETKLKEKHQKEIEKLNRDYETKIKELSSKNNQWEQKYSKLENISKNQSNYLSVPNLYALISKHKHYQTIQWKYSEKDIKEREFLKGLLDKLWSFAS